MWTSLLIWTFSFSILSYASDVLAIQLTAHYLFLYFYRFKFRLLATEAVKNRGVTPLTSYTKQLKQFGHSVSTQPCSPKVPTWILVKKHICSNWWDIKVRNFRSDITVFQKLRPFEIWDFHVFQGSENHISSLKHFQFAISWDRSVTER